MGYFNIRCLIIILIWFSVQVEESELKRVSGESNFLRDYYNGGRPLSFEFYLYDFELSDYYGKLMESGSLAYKFQKEWDNIIGTISRESIDIQCFEQFAILMGGLAKNDLTSMKYFDSWGKMPSGVLQGHLFEMGNFDECVEIKKLLANTNQLIGKYCIATIPVGQYVTNSSDVGDFLNLNIGVCVPKVCTAAQFNILFRRFLKIILGETFVNEMNMGPLVKDSSCILKEKERFGALQWFAISVLVALGLTLGLSTSYECLSRCKGESANPLLKSFSVLSNMEGLMRVTPNEKSPNAIHCLNGIRCLSLIWVVIGHSLLYALLGPSINIIDVLQWKTTVYSMFFQYAVFSVDSFFFLSGLLVSYIALRDMERNNGVLNVPLMYLHRFLRLTPMVALAILVYAAMYHYMGNGPVWNIYEDMNLFCKKNWWSTLLFIQNYANVKETCVGHTWYLAVDTQLYVLSPVLLIVLWKWGKKGIAAIIIIGLLCAACLFTTIMVNDLKFHIMGGTVPVGDAMFKTYFSTHLRASPWIIGLILGYFMHKQSGRRNSLPKFAVMIGWVTSLGLFATVLFAFYPKHQDGAADVTTLEEAFYWTLARIAWPLALCWLVFACANGYGGIINEFLSAPIWQPLSRLSYTIYIWHMFIEGINAGGTKTNTFFSNYNIALTFWGDFGWTLLWATVMYLAVEAPLGHIERALLQRRNRSTSSKSLSQRNLVEAVDKF